MRLVVDTGVLVGDLLVSRTLNSLRLAWGASGQ